MFLDCVFKQSQVRFLFLITGLAIGLSACASGEVLTSRSESLTQQLKEAYSPAYKCEPEALAKAESHLEFLKIELQQGDYFRAKEHLQIADENTRIAKSALKRKECLLDSDGDRIPDIIDQCKLKPETYNQFEDEDGCPDDKDSDGDKINDLVDMCPDQPEDYDGDEDQDGCPDYTQDRDGDGILDADDQCPLQPEDKDNFEDVDGCPDPDNDQDKILDKVDKCPLRPEDQDGFEDQDGCPDPDNDQDRINDDVDQCPNQPEDYDGDEDQDGCPDLYKRIVVRADRIDLKQKVYFATNKDRILEKSFDLLNEVAQALRDYPKLIVSIEGHTDDQGKDSYNLDLSQRRAESVLRYLVGQGIERNRMRSKGYGESQPIDDNRTVDGRAANRRVEFLIVKETEKE
jgi:outer membrane protein OmpA-like peptidoglycan-associated protein